MAYEKIDLETPQPNGKVGEPGPTAWAKARRMFKELYDSWTASSQALAKVTPAANKLPYFTGADTAAAADFTETGRKLAAAADQSAIFQVLGGTDIGKALFQSADASAARGLLSARGLGGLQVFTSNGSWTTPANCKGWRAMVIGAGAGGAGALSSNPGSGGGGGGLATKTNFSPTPGEVIAVTVGSGGAKGVKNASNGAPGGPGGSSSFGSYCSATGGQSIGYGLPGPSGYGTGGDYNTGTGNGGLGVVRGTDTARYFGGLGGGQWGGIGRYDTDATGGQGWGSGGGGGGNGPESASDGSTGVRNGGPGASGIVIVEWW